MQERAEAKPADPSPVLPPTAMKRWTFLVFGALVALGLGLRAFNATRGLPELLERV